MLVSTKQYLKSIKDDLMGGNATEHTHRSALETFVEALAPNVKATNEPTRVECGAPDFLISRTPGPVTIGYIEAKDAGVSLDEAERSEQLRRYRRSLRNLVLTDYLEFRWYVDGEKRGTARLARPDARGKLARNKDGDAEVISLLGNFLSHAPQPVANPRELAEHMARLTHLVRDIIVETVNKGKASELLTDLRGAFAKTLIPDLDQPEKAGEFADMYSQTLAYGLFAARCNHRAPKPFQRLGAAAEIPKTNPFLRRLFETITGPDLDDEPYVPFVDDLVQILAHADIQAILAQFGKRTRQEDPVVHFYETFLATYDQRLREKRGVYYTPLPVVSYIVRSIDHLLRTRFGLSDGLADSMTVTYDRDVDGKTPHKVKTTAPRVVILDPACGTGTFLYAVVELIRERFTGRGNAGMWSAYVKTHLLPRLFGFELLMAPYAVAHLKLGMQLAAQDLDEAQRKVWAYDFSSDDRLGIFMTNTLEEAEHQSESLFGPWRAISDEANAAAWVKRDLPILVVLGNPPYAGHSANKGEWITNLVADYKKGVPGLDKPAQAKWLQDDYVKFIRWGQWRIESTGAGILAFISNHSYLDNPTFRGMRQQLMNAFSDIYLLNLHGNTKKKERAPGGVRDENVFDIQQGVAIGIFVKEAGRAGPAKVHYLDQWGGRKDKYEWLGEKAIETTEWNEIGPDAPTYLFIPQDADLRTEYENGWKLPDIFGENGDPAPGIVTTQDEFAISFSADEAREKVRRFLATGSEAEARAIWRLCSQSQWNYDRAKKALASGTWQSEVKPILYRPFDLRYTVFDPNVAVHRRMRVTHHMLCRENLGLVSARSNKSPDPDHFLCSRLMTEAKCGESTTQSHIFPLYLYSIPSTQQGLPVIVEASSAHTARHGNLSTAFIRDLGGRLGLTFLEDGEGDLWKTFGPEDCFHYIYAVFYSPSYRSRYADFLKLDYPRVPLTSNLVLFRSLCSVGRDLVALHLLESSALAELITRYPIVGDNRVEKGYPKYVAPGEPEPGSGQPLNKGRVYINKAQYFEGVRPEIWEFHIGGYRVGERWLKDRRGRRLSYDDLTHYQKVIAALSETIRLMGEIDQTIPSWPIR